MENIIKKAIENGYGCYVGKSWEVKNVIPLKNREKQTWTAEVCTDNETNNGEKWYRHHVIDNPFMDAKFWKSLFMEYKVGLPFNIYRRGKPQWYDQALIFHENNLINGIDAAIAQLEKNVC